MTTEKSISLKSEYKIYAIYPEKFKKIQLQDNLTQNDLIHSLSTDLNRKRIFKAGKGGGRSGSFFFFSNDSKLVVKTLRGEEKQVLVTMLDTYIAYFEKVPNSLISKIYGVYTLEIQDLKSIDVIIMQNTQNLIKPKNKLLEFDLKGSLHKRF